MWAHWRDWLFEVQKSRQQQGAAAALMLLTKTRSLLGRQIAEKCDACNQQAYDFYQLNGLFGLGILLFYYVEHT
jgi:hypothetical protein